MFCEERASGILIILAVIGVVISGCADKTESDGAYAEKGQAAPSDPHVVESTFGGYDIKGDVEGNVGNYRFKVEQKDMHIGGGADAVGIIDDKGLEVYMNKKFADGAVINIGKGGFGVPGEEKLPLQPIVGQQEIVKAKFDLNFLDYLNQKYGGLSVGDTILIVDDKDDAYPFVRIILQE